MFLYSKFTINKIVCVNYVNLLNTYGVNILKSMLLLSGFKMYVFTDHF